MLGQPHACAFRPHSPVCLWLPPQHRECGPDSGSSQGGQEEEGWQPVSSLATVTQQPRGLGASPFRKQPALPYSADCFCTTSSPSGVRSGRHFLRAEREGTLHPKAENKECARRQASAARSWRCLVLFPGVGAQSGLAVQVPWRQRHCQQGAGEEARSRGVHPWSRRGVQKKQALR